MFYQFLDDIVPDRIATQHANMVDDASTKFFWNATDPMLHYDTSVLICAETDNITKDTVINYLKACIICIIKALSN